MSDQFTQFHYKLSKGSHSPDYEAENFDIKDIYLHSSLKVRLTNMHTGFLLLTTLFYSLSIGRAQRRCSWIGCSQIP